MLADLFRMMRGESSKKFGKMCFVFFLFFAMLVFFWILSGPRLFFPSLHMDESLYVGAAQRILHGDIFLNHYWFDKFFLVPYLVAAGILIGGENSLGFRFAALVCTSATLWVFMKLIWDLTFTLKERVIGLFFAIFCFFSSFMMFYHVSSFTDPFLLFFLCLHAKYLWKASNQIGTKKNFNLEKSYLFFVLACLSKLSALMWAPMLLFFWWNEGKFQGILSGLISFLRKTKWWIFGAVAFSLANPEKLAPILWFKHLGRGDKPPLFERAALWIEKSLEIFSNSFASISVLTLILVVPCWGVVEYFMAKRKKNESLLPGDQLLLVVFVLPFLCHVVGLWLSGAAVFSRYLYILIPQGILALVVSLAFIKKSPWAGLKLNGIVGMMALTCLVIFQDIGTGYQDVERETQSINFGRSLYQVRDELPRNSVVHGEGILWYLYPFDRGRQIDQACSRPECFIEERRGRSIFGAQYHLSEKALLQHFPKLEQKHSKSYLVQIEDVLSTARLKEVFRIGGWAHEVKWNISKSPSNPPAFDIDGSEKEKWREPPSLGFEMTVPSKKLPILGVKHLKIRGQLTVMNGPRVQNVFGLGRWALALRLEEIQISGTGLNLVDLAPIVYKSYVIPVAPLDIPSGNESERVPHEMLRGLHLTQFDELNQMGQALEVLIFSQL